MRAQTIRDLQTHDVGRQMKALLERIAVALEESNRIHKEGDEEESRRENARANHRDALAEQMGQIMKLMTEINERSAATEKQAKQIRQELDILSGAKPKPPASS